MTGAGSGNDEGCGRDDCTSEDATDGGDGNGDTDRFRLGDIVTVLTHSVRRRVLLVLDDADGELTLADLAAAVEQSEAVGDAEPVPDDHWDRVELRLYHVHVPKLATEGLVAFDRRNLTVRITAEGEEAVRRLF